MLQKVLFVQKLGDGQFETESIWCQKVGEDFVIDNIPFIAKRISLGDTVKAIFDNRDRSYYFEDFIKVSGNTTVRIYFQIENITESIREWLMQMGCESEVFLQRKIIAVNIPRETSYAPVKEFLEKGEKDGY